MVFKSVPFLPAISLLVISVPLVSFAVFTTTLSVLILAARVSLVYIELGVALLQALFSRPSQTFQPSKRIAARPRTANQVRH